MKAWFLWFLRLGFCDFGIPKLLFGRSGIAFWNLIFELKNFASFFIEIDFEYPTLKTSFFKLDLVAFIMASTTSLT